MTMNSCPFWSPFRRAFRKTHYTFTSDGAAADAINRVAQPYVYPIPYANDGDHLKW